MPVLDAALLGFLDAARRAVLATIGPGGRPRPLPVCFAVAGDAIWTPLDLKPKRGLDPRSLARVRDVLARPQVALLVDRWSEDWADLAWLRVEGTADLIEPGGAGHIAAVAALRQRYPQYATQPLEGRPLIRIQPTRALAWGRVAERG